MLFLILELLFSLSTEESWQQHWILFTYCASVSVQQKHGKSWSCYSPESRCVGKIVLHCFLLIRSHQSSPVLKCSETGAFRRVFTGPSVACSITEYLIFLAEGARKFRKCACTSSVPSLSEKQLPSLKAGLCCVWFSLHEINVAIVLLLRW